MKKSLFIAIGLIAFILTGCSNNDGPTGDPEQFVHRVVLQSRPFWAAQAYRLEHKSEIDKTLMINEVEKTGILRAIFFSYSIGAEVVRDVVWTAEVAGNLYMVSDWRLDEDAAEYGSTVDEIKRIEFKKRQWEEKPKVFWAD